MSSISSSDQAMDFIPQPPNPEVDKYLTTDSHHQPQQQHAPPLPVKTVLPLVYIQPSKLPLSKNTNANNVLVNTVPHQLQFATIAPNVSKNQGVILTPVKNLNRTKAQQLVIQKPGMQVVTNSKIGTLLTMIKPSSQGDIMTPSNNKSFVPTNSRGQQFVLRPMPKVIKDHRLPVTVTTSSTMQSKIAIMPFLPPSSSNNNNTDNKNIFNIKLDQADERNRRDDDCKRNMICEESLDESPVKSEKEYQLSIVEDSDSNPRPDAITINLPSDTALTPLKLPLPNNNNKDCLNKLPKHGVSILKKNYLQSDNKVVMMSNKSDSTTLLAPAPDSNTGIELIPEPEKTKSQKPERRRKSNFSYRKDYDEVEPITDFVDKKMNNKNEENGSNRLGEVDLVKDKSDINMNDDFDIKQILKWEEGIGTLPGSNLKFILNEFNMIEFVTKEDYSKILEKKRKDATKINNDQFQEEMRCLECGCYGLPTEFISPKHCSFDCQEIAKNKQTKEKEPTKIKKKRKRGANNNNHNNNNNNNNNNSKNKDSDDEEADNTSNENSLDRYAYPWTCSKKGFSWTKYLEHIKAKAAPEKLFKDPFPYNRNSFRAGMKLEGIDLQHPSYFCVLTVAEVCGYRIRLHFDGYPENYDFWLNADSRNIFPVGWCEKHGHILQPPAGFTVETFNWMSYLKQTKSTAAPKHLFANRVGNSICPNGFRVGMKLEAVDRKNTSLVCVATVRDMMDNRILVHFDSWDDIYDYWADPTSPYIHPVGWCDQYGHRLTPPNAGRSNQLTILDYPNPETFSWSKYLKETKSVAAPVRAFKQRATNGFKRGMRLECVDKRVPQLIRAATVDDVKDHQIRIQFDGWPDRYSYWVDDDNENIHPVGWCQKTGHPIETPLTPADVYDFLECPTVGCRGVGHIQGPKYQTHSEQKYCPYAEDNIDVEKVLPDRLLSPDRCVEAVVPISIEPKEKSNKPRMGRPPKCPKIEPPEPIKIEDEDDDSMAAAAAVKVQVKPKRKYRKKIKVEQPVSVSVSEDDSCSSSKRESLMDLIENSKIDPAEKETWLKHSNFLRDFIQDDTNALKWNSDTVQEFIKIIPGCENGNAAAAFKCREIDGEAFLSLSQKDLIDLLGMKVGPAVKLYNAIVLLRKNLTHNLFS